MLFLTHNYKQIRLACKSKYNRKCHNQVISLIINDGNRSDEGKQWHYLAVTSLSRLLRGMTSNHNKEFTF